MRILKPAALVATLALAVLAAPAQAGRLGIAFAGRSGPGNTDIFTAQPDGTARHSVTSGPASDTLPAWSPLRGQIVFTRDATSKQRHLFLVAPSGSGPHAIPHTLGGGAPSWSPDGARIAFDSSAGGGPSRIFTITPTGAARTQLTAGPDDSRPDWSPDSSHIVFARHGQVWTMAADGSQLKRLTNDGTEPAWAPDGKRIAFVRRIDREGGGKSFALFGMDATGANVHQLTLKGHCASSKPADCKQDDHRPAWEPNSRHIVYSETVGGASKVRTILYAGTKGVSTLVTAGQTPAW